MQIELVLVLVWIIFETFFLNIEEQWVYQKTGR